VSLDWSGKSAQLSVSETECGVIRTAPAVYVWPNEMYVTWWAVCKPPNAAVTTTITARMVQRNCFRVSFCQTVCFSSSMSDKTRLPLGAGKCMVIVPSSSWLATRILTAGNAPNA